MKKYVVYNVLTMKVVKLSDENFDLIKSDEDYDLVSNWIQFPEYEAKIKEYLSTKQESVCYDIF
jgi:hypothetical protein